jgi:hypothetical protein
VHPVSAWCLFDHLAAKDLAECQLCTVRHIHSTVVLVSRANTNGFRTRSAPARRGCPG